MNDITQAIPEKPKRPIHILLRRFEHSLSQQAYMHGYPLVS